MNYPDIEPGASLLIAWQIKGKSVLIVGGGNVAAGRLLNLLNAGSIVTLVSPRLGLNDEVKYRIDHNQVARYHDRLFIPSDLDGMNMVLTAIDSPEASSQIWRLCKERRVPVNVADVPSECDFYFGSQHRDGPLQIMISTGGQAPRLTHIIRKQIARGLPSNIGSAITQVGLLRQKLRQYAPGPQQGPQRMGWMTRVCDDWSLTELSRLNDAIIDQLLSFYNDSKVPSYQQLTGRQIDERDVWMEVGFEGSMGFAC